jgi:thioesterase domain-containing protein
MILSSTKPEAIHHHARLFEVVYSRNKHLLERRLKKVVAKAVNALRSKDEVRVEAQEICLYSYEEKQCFTEIHNSLLKFLQTHH